MPRIIHTSNTSTAPPARDKRILRGDVSRPIASVELHPHQEHPTGIPLEHDHEQIRRHRQIWVNAELLRVRIKTMWEKKGCRMNMAPPGKNHTTSIDNEHPDNQEATSMAEGSELDTASGDDEGGGLNEDHDNERPQISC